MSKRGAEFYLTDRNYNSYNDDGDEDDGEGNTFKRASDDVLRKRKIKPLKRRTRAAFKQNSDKPSSLSAFSFKAPTTTTTSTVSNPITSATLSNTDNDMKNKVKKFTEQICGLNESFVSFITKSIKEDIVFDISLNIGQYQDKRKEIEKEYDDVIKYLTNNKDALKKASASKPTFSFTNSKESKPKETKPFSFSFGNTSNNTTTTDKPTTNTSPFTFNKPDSKPASSFTFNKPDNKPASSFTFNKPDNKSTTTSTFTFNKPDNKTTSPFTFNVNKDNSEKNTTTTTTTTTSSAPLFSFKKPEENKDGVTAASKPTVPTFKPFTFNFGQKMANSTSEDQGKTLPKPNFSFGVAPPSKSEISAASTDDDNEEPSEQVQLTTGAGEEDEEAIFEVKAKVHYYSMEEKKYVSRGLGLLKVNKNKKTGKARLLGRMDNGTVFLNVSLFKEMVVSDPAGANQFTFNAMDRLEDSNEVKLIRFAVRVKDKEAAKKLYDAIIENKK